MSSKESTPRSTSERATAPLNAFEVLAIRMCLRGLKGRSLSTSATPAVMNRSRLPRRSTAEAPGGPPLISTR